MVALKQPGHTIVMSGSFSPPRPFLEKSDAAIWDCSSVSPSAGQVPPFNLTTAPQASQARPGAEGAGRA